MAGTLFGLGLSQQVDATGTPLSGALLYIYEENSSTPAQTFADFTLSTLQTFPIEADSAGRLPQIWVEDGSYRARLTTSAGVEVFDESSVTAIGASVTTGGGSGSSGTSVSSEAIFNTGDVKWKPFIGTESGWVRANGRTLGSGASGATERANSDTQALFEYLWTNFSNTLCPVSTGRGATATADFNANKTITLYTMRGRGAFGLDDMGNSVAGVLAAGTPTVISVSGAESTTISQANLPNVNLSSTGLTVVSSFSAATAPSGGGSVANNSSGSDFSVTATVTGTIPLGGLGTAVNKMPPYMLGTFYVKL